MLSLPPPPPPPPPSVLLVELLLELRLGARGLTKLRNLFPDFFFDGTVAFRLRSDESRTKLAYRVLGVQNNGL